MTTRITALLFLAIVVLFSGCQTPGMQNPGYPAEIIGVGDSSNFPVSAGAYKRGKMFMYEPGMTNHSVAYNRVDSALQNAVTLYFYPKPASLEQQFQLEKQQILMAHRGSVLLTEREETIQKNGSSYSGRVATFRYEENFSGKRQSVHSQLVLVDLTDRYFKVRSTAPLDQGKFAEASVFGLLELVNWAY